MLCLPLQNAFVEGHGSPLLNAVAAAQMKRQLPRALNATLGEVSNERADYMVCVQSGNGLPPMADIPMGRSEDIVHLRNCKNAFLNEVIEQGRNDSPPN
jgi:hypothetical protein